MNLADRRDECDYFNAVNLFEVPFGDCASGNTTCSSHPVRSGAGRRKIGLTDGLASTASPTSAACLDPILFEVSIVCVTGSGVEVCFGVVFWALILISD